jgi:Phosphodiester glycosidase
MFGMAAITGLLLIYAFAGLFGLQVLWRRGGSIWVETSAADTQLPRPMQLALGQTVPPVKPGPLTWRTLEDGFEVADLDVMAEDGVVEQIHLARIAPGKFRFKLLNAPTGARDPQDWMTATNAVMVINGGYYAPDGTPATPVLSNGAPLGPASYDAQHGAFIAADGGASVVDLAGTSWQAAFVGATDAFVSYPMLIGADGTARAKGKSTWLANRSFAGMDSQGRILLGTTSGAFFSLDRFGRFLADAPLDLTRALNLDGGPVACQSIAIANFWRAVCSKWETAEYDGKVKLLKPVNGNMNWGLPIVIAITRK